MKKTKIPSHKELENNFSSWKSAGAKKIAEVKERNRALREKKEEKFTARLSSADFKGLKDVAAKKGIGYQTLLGIVIHEYVNGTLVDVEEIRKVLPTLKAKKKASKIAG